MPRIPVVHLRQKRRALLPALVLHLCVFSLPVVGLGQSPVSGVVVGFVINESTQKVLERATVNVAGTNLSTLTAADGSFRLVGVPTGPQQIQVGYTGLQDATTTVTVESDRATS